MASKSALSRPARPARRGRVSPTVAGAPRETANASGNPAALFPAALVTTIQSGDIDDLVDAAVGWNRDCTQLRPGRFFGKVAAVHTAQMQMGLVSWNTSVQARGQAPRGTRAIAVPIGPNPAPSFCGSTVAAREIVTAAEGTEVDFRGAATCEFLVLSIGIGLLDRQAIARWGEPLESRVADGRINLGSVAARARLAQSWSSVFAKVRRDPAALSNPHVAHMVEQSVINALLEVAGPPTGRSLPARRQVLARCAEEFIRGKIHSHISLADICDWVGASERSLHLGFLERFGMSPMAYLKVLRLNGVRRLLRDAPAGISVTELAMRSGFQHLGRFATDYHHFFGERPSATLRAHAQRSVLAN
ncbi:MAG TPA: helix-turn-helix domain-containing protein [Burkholderiaceae bacterium]|nr:helix-turn-helix domain-containing protein [Burkholderiaceae bacterium]